MTEALPWPPYCGAERLRSTITFVDGRINIVEGDREVGGHITAVAKDVEAVCTRACHPNTEQHVDVERGVSWTEPGHYLKQPFTPSSDS